MRYHASVAGPAPVGRAALAELSVPAFAALMRGYFELDVDFEFADTLAPGLVVSPRVARAARLRGCGGLGNLFPVCSGLRNPRCRRDLAGRFARAQDLPPHPPSGYIFS